MRTCDVKLKNSFQDLLVSRVRRVLSPSTGRPDRSIEGGTGILQPGWPGAVEAGERSLID